MQNKPVIYFSTYDDIKNPHYGGGGAVAVHEIAKRLSKKFDIRILSWDYCGKKNEVIDSVHYERFGLSSLSPKIAMFAYQIYLPFIMRSKKFDTWIESFCPPFTTAFLPMFTKKPVIGIVHMLAAVDMERKYKLPFHIIQNSGLKKYKNIIVTSDVLKNKIKKMHDCNMAVISNGINKVCTPIYKKQQYILFLGRIEIDQKGIDLLISAFKKFNGKNNEFKLIIAGNGNPKEVEKINELIKENSLQKYIVLKGKVSGIAKDSLLKNAACVAVSSRFETYSLVALEAMAYSAPLVHFDIEGLKWIPNNVSQKVKPYDIIDFSEALTRVILQTKSTNAMIKEGNEYAKKFTWDSLAKKYEEYIMSLDK
jgi:glycosyltransferase involved in cell wall biosynthesis